MWLSLPLCRYEYIAHTWHKVGINNGLEVCPITKSDFQSLDCVVDRFFMKLFTTKNIETVKYCQEYFSFSLSSVSWAKQVSKYELSFGCFLSVL